MEGVLMNTTLELMKRITDVLIEEPATMRDVGDSLEKEGYVRKDVYNAMRKMNKSKLICTRELNREQNYVRIWKVKS